MSYYSAPYGYGCFPMVVYLPGGISVELKADGTWSSGNVNENNLTQLQYTMADINSEMNIIMWLLVRELRRGENPK